MDMINYILLAVCLCCPAAVIWAYRQGIKDGTSLRDNKPLDPIVTMPEPERKPTPEEVNASLSWQNMMNYDGTRESQVDLKE